MSSSLSLFACIENLDRVISCLHDPGDEEGNQKKQESENWEIDNEEWDWENESESKTINDEENFDDKRSQTNWLQDCCIGVSPYEDLIAIGRNEKLVILSAKWDRQATSEPKTKFEISWTGQLVLEDGECISSLLCLPLASQHRSSQGFPDWTCIVAGFTSGYIRFYLQDGSLLLYQLLHEDPVLKLKCQTWQPGVTHTDFEQVEELVILYPTTLVLLDGFSLYQSLRGCRNQLARAQASGTTESIKPPPLAYKKWNLKDQKNITDIASCGIVTPSLFDQLQTASFIGGCDASIRITPPAMSQFVTTGSDPFVGVYSAVEGGSPPLISEVALEVATKLTTAVLSKLSVAGGWLGWGLSKREPTKQTQDTSKSKPKVEKGTSLPLRYSLSDQRREGTTITLSPDERLAVSTDEFGRVMLINTKQGIVLRTWKGYRDAECGWIPVQEEAHDIGKTNSNSAEQAKRTALFLIIHAPRRGILEVWTAECGPRAAAFNVGRDCRFLYTGHHILGLSHVMGQSSENSLKPVRCMLLQPNGHIKVLTVPFHCALSDKYSRRVRDLHLLKKLSTILDHSKEEGALQGRSMEKLETTILEILTSIQVPILLQQGLQCILSTVGLPVSLLEKAVSSVSENILKKPNVSDDHELEDECDIQTVLDFTKVQIQIIQLYKTLCDEKGEQKIMKDLSHSVTDVVQDKTKWLASLLSLTTSETATLLNSIEKYWELTDKPTEIDNKPFDIMTTTNFLSCFEVATGAVIKSPTNPTTSTEKVFIRIRKNLSSETLAKLGNCVFKDTFYGFLAPEKLCLILECSNIFPLDLLDLLVFHWLSKDEKQLKDVTGITTLHTLVSTISSMSGVESGPGLENVECSNLSAWWEKLRHLLAESMVCSQSLAAAVCCRSVVMTKQAIAKKLEEDHEGDKEIDWVSISMEIERWNLLVNQLDDLLNLAIFCLSVDSVQEDPSSLSDVLANLSVLNILGRGRSGITEIVAKVVVQHAIEPRRLGYPCSRTKQRKRSTDVDDDIPEEVPKDPDPDQLLEGLPLLRKRFPYSLDQDILWAHCSHEYIKQWMANKKLSGFLQKSLEHTKYIDNWKLKHGICVLIWNEVKDSVSAMTILTEKVGKAPKERLCLKAMGISGSPLILFLKSTRSVLQCLAEVTHEEYDGNGDAEEKMISDVEDFWKTGETLPSSFVDEAVETKESNHEIVVVHYWLVSLVWLIMALGMKGVKPLSLIGGKERKLLFKGMDSFYESKEVEQAVTEERKMFFPKALSALVQLLSTESSQKNDRDLQQLVDEWCTVIYDLAQHDLVDIDQLKADFVCELCSAGLHKLSLKAFIAVYDKASLSSKLLKIIGQRLAEKIFDCEDPGVTARILSSIPMSVSSWIRKQDPSRLRKKDVPLSGVNELLSLVLTGLSGDGKEHEIATSLAEILKTLT